MSEMPATLLITLVVIESITSTAHCPPVSSRTPPSISFCEEATHGPRIHASGRAGGQINQGKAGKAAGRLTSSLCLVIAPTPEDAMFNCG
jgi:hypothetical protein